MKRFFNIAVLLLAAVVLFAAVPQTTLSAAALPDMVYGIDVSSYKGTIDFGAVKASGVDFVILRAGTSFGKDTKFEENYIAAKAAGLDVGCFYYTYALTPAQVESETAALLGWLSGKTMEYPVYFDIEDSDYQSMTNAERTTLCLTFLSQVKEAGWLGGIYSYKYWFENLLDLPTLMSQGEIWLAHWTASAQPDIDYSAYGLWQYASDAHVNGVNGDVDVDVAFRDYPAIVRQGGWNGYTAPMPVKGGDVDGDGHISTTDARLVLQYTAGKLTADALDLTQADVDRDGGVSTTDARLVLQYAAGKIKHYTV